MKITTRYNINDKVFTIQKIKTKVFASCGFCPGNQGWIYGENKEKRMCPDCRAEGQRQVGLFEEYLVNPTSITIRHIRVQLKKSGITSEEYANWVGGGGRIHDVETLFVTIEDAQFECDKRNAELRVKQYAKEEIGGKT